MASRRKSKMKFVQSQKARVDTFRRRRKSLMKKAYELSKLCGVDVAVMIYAGEVSDRPKVYPPESSEALRILQKFKKGPEKAGFTQKPENSRSEEQIFTRMNEKQTGECDDDIRNLSIDELQSLLQTLNSQTAKAENKTKTIKEKKEIFSETFLVESFDLDSVYAGDCYLKCASETTIPHHRSELSGPQPLNFQWPTSLPDSFDEDLTTSEAIVSEGTPDLEQGTSAATISDQAMDWNPSPEFSEFDMEDFFLENKRRTIIVGVGGSHPLLEY